MKRSISTSKITPPKSRRVQKLKAKNKKAFAKMDKKLKKKVKR